MGTKRKVLIICTHNSCRSIMAEALVGRYLGETWEAYSAGVAPTEVNPRARQVLTEIGVDTSGSYSKSVMEFLNRTDLDLVITVCDEAKEACPVFPGKARQVHIGFEDPSLYTDLPDEIALPKFRELRDLIKKRLLAELH